MLADKAQLGIEGHPAVRVCMIWLLPFDQIRAQDLP